MDIVVVGAGQAGSSLVGKLRALGFDGAVTLVGEEPVLPYQRPPLSKGYLLGEMGLDRLYLRSEGFYADHDIALKLGAQVTGIDREHKELHLRETRLSYDLLALTTGSEPRRLPAAIGGDLGGVFTVRTLADIDRMQPELTEGRRALIIGGGYIGLEAAAVCAKLGMQVTLVEMADRILQRVAAPQTSDFFRALHRGHGVDIREGTGLETLIGTDRVTGALLTDGEVLEADVVIVGVGITPCTQLAELGGLMIDNGISTDARGRTSDPSIYAAGDCASFPHGGGRIRLESVGNAIDHAELVAENMLGAEKHYMARPWFWSDQYDCKLQIAGLNTGYDEIVTRQGEGGAVSFWYYGGGRLLAVDSMNDSRAYMVGKRLIESGRSADKAAVADPATELKALLKA